MPLLLHNQAGWAKAWVRVEVEAKAQKQGLHGPRGLSTASNLKLSLHIRVHFYSLTYGQEYCLILVHLIPLLLHHV